MKRTPSKKRNQIRHILAYLSIACIAALVSCSTRSTTLKKENSTSQAQEHEQKPKPTVVSPSPPQIESKLEEEIMDAEMDMATESSMHMSGRKSMLRKSKKEIQPVIVGAVQEIPQEQYDTEEYAHIKEKGFSTPQLNPYSTFSIDTDGASYTNARRMINYGTVPQPDVVRIEEFINYFDYDYLGPKDDKPFAVHTEVAECPWNDGHKLVHVGIQGKKVDYDNLQSSNLVFLVDVSGSMEDRNKLPLLRSSFKLLLSELSAKDRVSIVVYAGAAGLVLPPTPATEKETIIDVLDRLQAGGSTAGGAGIELAYKVAEEAFIENGNNRVILATDGDFNIGNSSTGNLVRMIEEKRKSGVFLTICGFGMGNYKDYRMEEISNAGNGNYYYIDNIKEARKVFVTEMRGTLFTIAKDVKIQVEFNPSVVQAYRLIGYENRMLADRDFNDDKKDAGELGAGHNVTAIYEVIPVGVESKWLPDVD